MFPPFSKKKSGLKLFLSVLTFKKRKIQNGRDPLHLNSQFFLSILHLMVSLKYTWSQGSQMENSPRKEKKGSRTRIEENQKELFPFSPIFSQTKKSKNANSWIIFLHQDSNIYLCRTKEMSSFSIRHDFLFVWASCSRWYLRMSWVGHDSYHIALVFKNFVTYRNL